MVYITIVYSTLLDKSSCSEWAMGVHGADGY